MVPDYAGPVPRRLADRTSHFAQKGETMFENLNTTETPTPEPTAKPTPWYRRWYTIAGATLAAAGLAAGIGLTALGHDSLNPADQLKADGYTSLMTKNQDQIASLAGTGGSQLKQYITTGVVGIKDGQVEIVFGLTPAGKSYMDANYSKVHDLDGSLPAGMTARVAGDNVVMDGSMSALSGS